MVDIDLQIKLLLRKLFVLLVYNYVIGKFCDTLEEFISWICRKFTISEKDNLVKDFQKKTNTFIGPEKQIKYEEKKE